MKFFNVLSVSSLLHVFEIWTLEKRDVMRLETADIKFKRETAEYGLMDSRRNEDMLELEVDPAENKLMHCKQN
jgi:hypothetical protein